MKSLLLASSMLAVAVAAYGQTTVCTGKLSTDKPTPVCHKYQSVEHWYVLDPAGNHIEDHCVDDMHPVTEREWQELMARLKKLESQNAAYRGAGLNAAHIAEQCLCTVRMDAARKIAQSISDDLKAKP